MKNQKLKQKNILRNVNILITFLAVLVNIAALGFCNSNKTGFILISIFGNILVFFIHWFIIAKLIKKNINEMKREALYINYALNTVTLFFFIFVILLISTVILYIVNKDAFNLAFIFTFFMSVLSMLFPSVVLLVYVFFVFPSFILPGISSNRHDKDGSMWLLYILLFLFLGFSVYKFVQYSIRTNNIIVQDKYKIIKLPVQYSTEYLKIEDISPYGKKKLSQVKLVVPFVYTAESFNVDNYRSAEIFCDSMGAKVPSYLEMYNIAFNKFDTFGEKYYWTRNFDGKTPILLHFKNMSYNLVKYDGKVKPLLYCTTNSEENKQAASRNYLYKNIKQENKALLKEMVEKPFDDKSILDIIGKDYKPGDYKQEKEIVPEIDVKKELKHVSFSVKEVSSDVMQNLIRQGYNYDPKLKINSKYETNEVALNSRINIDVNKKNIRLCYFPFTDYGNLNRFNESQIWQQSFCSPAFTLIDSVPVLKSRYEKDSYCIAKGGRLPNIPELNGILKSLKINNIDVKYWTNNKITDSVSDSTQPVMVYYKDSRFMKVQALNQNEQGSALVYCIKKADNPSKIIANYTSRFKGMDGSSYARQKCQNCQYYEVPDTIISNY